MNSIGVYDAKSDSAQNNNSFEFQSAQQTNYGNSTFYKPSCNTGDDVGSISRNAKVGEANIMSPLNVIDNPINNDERNLNENISVSLCCCCRRQVNYVATDSFIEDKQCSTFEIQESHLYHTENVHTVPGAANEVPTYHENRYTHKENQESKKRSKLQELLDLKIYRKYGHEKKLKSNIKQEDTPDQTGDKESQKAFKKSKRKDIFQRLRKLRDSEGVSWDNHSSNNQWDSKQRKRTELSDASVATVLSLDHVEIIETEYLKRTQPDNLPNDDDSEVRFYLIIQFCSCSCEYY